MSGLRREDGRRIRTVSNKEILETALSAYGSEIQRIVAIEELSELQKELCKSLRGQTDKQHIAEEIADVQIMMEQMMILYELHYYVASWKQKKMDRLRDRLARDGIK